MALQLGTIVSALKTFAFSDRREFPDHDLQRLMRAADEALSPKDVPGNARQAQDSVRAVVRYLVRAVEAGTSTGEELTNTIADATRRLGEADSVSADARPDDPLVSVVRALPELAEAVDVLGLFIDRDTPLLGTQRGVRFAEGHPEAVLETTLATLVSEASFRRLEIRESALEGVDQLIRAVHRNLPSGDVAEAEFQAYVTAADTYYNARRGMDLVQVFRGPTGDSGDSGEAGEAGETRDAEVSLAASLYETRRLQVSIDAANGDIVTAFKAEAYAATAFLRHHAVRATAREVFRVALESGDDNYRHALHNFLASCGDTGAAEAFSSAVRDLDLEVDHPALSEVLAVPAALEFRSNFDRLQDDAEGLGESPKVRQRQSAPRSNDENAALQVAFPAITVALRDLGRSGLAELAEQDGIRANQGVVDVLAGRSTVAFPSENELAGLRTRTGQAVHKLREVDAAPFVEPVRVAVGDYQAEIERRREVIGAALDALSSSRILRELANATVESSTVDELLASAGRLASRVAVVAGQEQLPVGAATSAALQHELENSPADPPVVRFLADRTAADNLLGHRAETGIDQLRTALTKFVPAQARAGFGESALALTEEPRPVPQSQRVFDRNALLRQGTPTDQVAFLLATRQDVTQLLARFDEVDRAVARDVAELSLADRQGFYRTVGRSRGGAASWARSGVLGPVCLPTHVIRAGRLRPDCHPNPLLLLMAQDRAVLTGMVLTGAVPAGVVPAAFHERRKDHGRRVGLAVPMGLEPREWRQVAAARRTRHQHPRRRWQDRPAG